MLFQSEQSLASGITMPHKRPSQLLTQTTFVVGQQSSVVYGSFKPPSCTDNICYLLQFRLCETMLFVHSQADHHKRYTHVCT